jgi:phenylacetate-CoA ligase
MYNYLRVLYYLNSLMRHTYWSREKLLDYQDRKVRAIVKYAYDHSGFYHERFRHFGIKPDDVQCVKDLNKLPIVEKSDLQKNFGQIISDEVDVNSLIIQKTSGSSGHPLSVYLSKKEHEFRMAKMLRANISCGQKPRDRWLVITAPHHINKEGGIRKLLGIYWPFSISVFEDVDAQLDFVRKFRPDVIESYSSSLVLLAKEMKCRGLKPECRLAIGGAEFIDGTSRRFIESVLGAPFFDQYASVELEAMAWQCEEKGDYHIDADSVVMQFVDENGEEVAPGESGEIVCTSLFNYAMPFIRYAIRDIGVSSAESCSCGRGFPVMKMVEGRADSFIHFPDGRIVVPRTLTIGMNMFSLSKCIERFRIIQTHKDNLDFIIQLKECNVDVSSFISTLEKYFEEKLHLKKSGVRMNVKFVDYLPLDQGGKLKSVVSNFSELRRES